jgi:8-oxo-dGTP pyrophosphatase MutT (NUDIX family)
LEQFIKKLKAELAKTLPGETAQYEMAPEGRKKSDQLLSDIFNYKQSAVMILCCVDVNNNWFIPLTQRFSYNGAHSGQISLPGGKYDENDLSLQQTAKRECFEEIGILDEIEMLGELTNLFIPVSAYSVAPFVGICKAKAPDFVPSAREVKTIIPFYINDLLNNSVLTHGTVDLEGRTDLQIKAPYFDVHPYKIWGATAMILNEFKNVVKPIF